MEDFQRVYFDESHVFTRDQMAPHIVARGPIPSAGLPRIAWGTATLPTLEERIKMASSVPVLPPFPGNVFSEFVEKMNRDIAQSHRTPEQEFQALQVQEGDRVRLTEVKNFPADVFNPARRVLVKEGSVLEGKIIGIKERNGKTQLRFAGFGHTGPNKAGGQHIWFSVEDFKVEVLHKVYRITDEDKLFAELAGLTEARWGALTEQQRADRRKRYAVRADKIRKLLAPKPDFN